ncbi:MAG: CYTH domain-containing protein [Candidatus Parcubacteria bacterium]|nr:CYTH domain-containing protein [Candidatus Parcubacteria bacterium]
MDKKPEIFYEIELKALLDEQEYQRIDQLLAGDKRFKLFNTETIKTSFFKDREKNDVRLRISDKTCEFVYKKGLVKEYCRLEIKIPLQNKETLEHFIEVMRLLPLHPERGTLKHKKEYYYKYNGFDYIVCLQHLENFAYILEVEFLAQTPAESEFHIKNIHEIFEDLKVEVINGEKFMERLYHYIAGENTINWPL